MEVNRKKKELVCGLVESARKFRFCGPSDDPDEITSVTAGFRHLVIQFQRLAAPMLSPPDQEGLERINVVIDDLYSAYDAHSEIEALLPDIEAALEMLDDGKSELSAMPSNEVLLQQVHSLRTMLINVGTESRAFRMWRRNIRGYAGTWPPSFVSWALPM
jgi:hypothetical protein